MAIDFSFFQPVFLIKIITLIIIGFYIIFTLVVFTQIKAMGEIINIPHASEIFKTIILVNAILAISLFLFAVVIL